MELLSALQARLGEKVSTNATIREAHGRDESYPEVHPPLAVVFAESASDVREVLAWAASAGVAVIPYGAGTSLEGQVIPQGPAVSLDLSRMNRILQVRPEDFLGAVEPGVTCQALNKALGRHGLFFPVDPGADASLGGMAATNASGTTTVRYGGMRQNVLALEVVLASGEVITAGRPVRKTSSGYDLKDLFIGSEGTLGIITRLDLKLHPLPAHVHTVRVFFPTLEAATQAAYLIMASALPVARLELLDAQGLRAINRNLERSYPESPALFLEFHSGTASAVEAESAEALALVAEAGATAVDVARTPQEREAQWEARHRLYWALVALYPGRQFMITDTAVPLSRMPELAASAHRLLAEMGLEGSIIGHVGDGNFHTLVAVAPEDYARAEAFSARLVEAALAVGGTTTGEHGVGLRKKRYLPLEHAGAYEWMRRIKVLLDPRGLLNPGKIV